MRRALGVSATLACIAWLALRPRRPTYSFEGRTVFITGGSRGLGLLLARELAAEGAKLALVARDSAELERAAAQLRRAGARVLPLAGDVRVRRQLDELIGRAEAELGPIDVLVNNAGVIQTGPIEHMGANDFEESLDVHLWGPLYAILGVLPRMRARGGGRIVNIASFGGKLGIPHLAPYCAGKSALVGLSEALQAELRKDGIRVTTVCPGLIRTGSHLNARFKGRHAREFAWFTLSASMPGLSIAGERAARRIVEACRRGTPSLVLTLPALFGIAANGLAPGLVGHGAALAARFLPGPEGSREGDIAKSGEQSRSALAPRWATALVDAAARRNNELKPESTA